MPRSEIVSVKIDIPDELTSEEEIRKYIAENVQKQLQGSTSEARADKGSGSGGRAVPSGKTLNTQKPASRRGDATIVGTKQELEAARIQLARLNQRYNLAASRVQGATRRKHLLRAISREQARVEMLEQQLRTPGLSR